MNLIVVLLRKEPPNMNRFVKPLSRAAATGILLAAVGIPGLALAADAGAPAAGTGMAKPVAQATMPAKAAKPMMAKHAAKTKRSTEIRALQEALNKTGATLHVDGVWGSKTHAALVNYQKTHDLKATGRIDKATRDSLKIT